MTKDELIQYVGERYSTDAEYPWADENYIFRHQGNRKWFAVAMSVPYRKLGIDRDGPMDIVDVKCGPLLIGAYRGQPGILPGYHMNSESCPVRISTGRMFGKTCPTRKLVFRRPSIIADSHEKMRFT